MHGEKTTENHPGVWFFTTHANTHSPKNLSFPDNHDLISVKFYELASNDAEDDPAQYLNIQPKADGAEPERGWFHLHYIPLAN